MADAKRLVQALLWCVLAVAPVWTAPAAHAISAEEATRVGGDLTVAGKKLAVLRDSGEKVAAAAPGAHRELVAALARIADAAGTRTFANQLAMLALSLAILGALVYALRRLTRRYQLVFRGDALRARGALCQFALDAADRAVVAAAAYLLIETWFHAATLQDLFAIAVLWAAVRWWFAMLLIEALLRPRTPAFRLIAMNDAAARDIKTIVAVTILVGFTGIAVMPVLLRAGLPVPAGQVIALLQGTLVAAGCALALWRYRASHSAPAQTGRLWTGFGATAVVGLWIAWSLSVLVLEFSTYHSFTWSMRIGAFAYLVHALLGLSSQARWVLLVQRSITAAALLAIAILLAETWLVDELKVVAAETWSAVRSSLVSAALTLVAGYVAWRYLYQWTDARLRAPAAGAAGEPVQPASRLTTVLPMLRILAGATILVVTVLLALSQLGVQITPLLAGAGVIGLAISFGAQTLVKDVITGAFFLVDDAFRVGEYIVSGTYKGEVEAITLRSVRLRHHRGSVYTVPFGELRAIQNMSRDWVIDKFSVGITYDSDIEKARKLIKQIGQTLAADPAHAPHILEPLKMQGVEQFGDFAVQLRIKMKTRPGQQFVIRRKANAMIKKAFDANGIKFAFPTVQVAGGSASDGIAAAAQQSLASAQPPPSGSA